MPKRRNEKRPRSPDEGERPADLYLWIADGAAGNFNARVAADIYVSLGITHSRRGMGFVVCNQKTGRVLWPDHEANETNFVLDRDQVATLIEYLRHRLLGMRRPFGRKKDTWVFERTTNPTVGLSANTKHISSNARGLLLLWEIPEAAEYIRTWVMRQPTNRERALANALYDAMTGVIGTHGDEEILTALLLMLCARVRVDPDPDRALQLALNMLKANFPMCDADIARHYGVMGQPRLRHHTGAPPDG